MLLEFRGCKVLKKNSDMDFGAPVSLTVPVSIGCGYREQYHGLLNFEMLRHILYQTVWIIKRLQQMFN